MQIASMTKFSGIIVKKNHPTQGSKLKNPQVAFWQPTREI